MPTYVNPSTYRQMEWENNKRGDLMFEELAAELGVTWEIKHPRLLAALEEFRKWYVVYASWNTTTYIRQILAVILRGYFPIWSEIV